MEGSLKAIGDKELAQRWKAEEAYHLVNGDTLIVAGKDCYILSENLQDHPELRETL